MKKIYNKNDAFFSIIHSWQIKDTAFSEKCVIDFDVIIWRAIFNKGMQVETKSQARCVYYSLNLSNFLRCNTSLRRTLIGKGGKLDIKLL